MRARPRTRGGGRRSRRGQDHSGRGDILPTGRRRPNALTAAAAGFDTPGKTPVCPTGPIRIPVEKEQNVMLRFELIK